LSPPRGRILRGEPTVPLKARDGKENDSCSGIILAVRKRTGEQPPPKSYTGISITLSVIAIVLSASGWWFNYATSLPAISPKVELVEPLVAGQQIHFRVLLENTGKTVAKQLHPSLAFRFAPPDVPFEPTYPSDQSVPQNWTPPTSDLVPGAHATLYSTNLLKLARDHDVNAVLHGDWNLYVFGKIRYKDILHITHEVHFCGFYRQVAGADPLKLSYCTSYNETE
jgi:hypothetical protein